MQDYLAEGDRNILVSKTIYKARGMTLDIKLQKKWKYDDIKCEGCHENIESGEEVLRCDELGINVYQADYTWFYSELVSKQIMAGKGMMKKMNGLNYIVIYFGCNNIIKNNHNFIFV